MNVKNKRGIEKKSFIYKDYNILYYKVNNKIVLCTDGLSNFESRFIYFNSINELKSFIDGYDLRNRSLEDIHYIHQNILLDYESDIVYHTSSISNRENILKNGLVAGKNIPMDLLKTSLFMDRHKTKNIPSKFYRTSSLYFHPKFVNWIDESESDLYAVDIQALNWYIGSYSLSGYCLYSLMNSNSEYENVDTKECLKWTKLYWKNCYSKKEFLEQTNDVKQSQSLYGLTEIMIPFKVPADRIAHIGYFSKGRFIPNKNFPSFVKDEYKDSYESILRYHLTR